MESVSEYLRRKREEKGIPLEEVSSVTRINYHILSLIEEGNWGALPATAFVRGFVSSYAKYLNVDSDEVLRIYDEETSDVTSQKNVDLVPPVEKSLRSVSGDSPNEVITRSQVFPWRKFGLVSFLVGFIALLLVLSYYGKNKIKEQVAQDQEMREQVVQTTRQQDALDRNQALNQSSIAVENSSQSTTTTSQAVVSEQSVTEPVNTVAKTTSKSHEIFVRASEKVWIKVYRDQLPAREYLLDSDQEKVFTADKKIKLVLGNNKVAQVFYNGTAADGVSKGKNVAHFVYPFSATFVSVSQRTSQRQPTQTPEPEVETPHNTLQIESLPDDYDGLSISTDR